MRYFSLLLLTCFLLYSCVRDDHFEEGGGGGDFPEIVSFRSGNVVPDRVLVKLKEEPVGGAVGYTRSGETVTGLTEFDALAASLGVKEIKRVFPYAGRFEERSRRHGLHLWYEVIFDGSVTATRAAGEMSLLGDIDIVEPVRRVNPLDYYKGPIVDESELAVMTRSGEAGTRASSPFNDPMSAYQWHYNNNGTGHPDYIAGADINLFEAWTIDGISNISAGHPDVIVAVVDGGIQASHPDLTANIWINTAETAGNGSDDDGNGYVDDLYGWNFVDGTATIEPNMHGTHVAGTIAAVNNNGIGVGGIAGGTSPGGTGVRLMSCQIFKDNPDYDENDPNSEQNISATTSQLAAAIKYGTDNGAVISQNSWVVSDWDGHTSPLLDAAIAYFIEEAGCDENGNQTGPMKGGIVIFAAGNENAQTAYPANKDNVIAVASMNPDYLKSSYSNYGSWVNITAPGGTGPVNGKYSTDYNYKCLVLSTYGTKDPADPDINKYIWMAGTSMACPHVSGIAALIISRYGVGRPGLTPDRVKNRIINTARDIYDYNPVYNGRLGSGYADARTALQTMSDSSLPDVYLGSPDDIYLVKLDSVFLDDVVSSYVITNTNTGAIGTTLDDDLLTVRPLKNGQATISVRALYASLQPMTATFKVMSRDDSREIDLYPNPTSGQVNLRMGREVSGAATVTVTDALGRKCLRSYISLDPFNPAVVNIGLLPSGTYTVTVQTADTKVSSEIIKF